MSMNPFKWFSRKAGNAYNDILAKADADMAREKAITGRTWGNTDPVVHIVKPSSFVDYSEPGKRQMQVPDVDAWKSGIEARIAALEDTIAAELPEQPAKTQQGESDEELMKRFKERANEAKTNTYAWIVYVGRHVWNLIQADKSFMPSQYHGTGMYHGVTVYLVKEKDSNYIS